MNYIVDMSWDGYEWEEYQVGGDLQAVLEVAMDQYEKGWFVTVWDRDERMIWRDGRLANVWDMPSPVAVEFERVWERGVANGMTTIALDGAYGSVERLGDRFYDESRES